MLTYCFIFGRNPILSLAEIFNREAPVGAHFQIAELTSQSLVIRTDAPFDPDAWQRTLGGSIKIGQVIQEFADLSSVRQALTKKNLLERYFGQKNKKIVFGFSCYGDLFRHYQTEFNGRGLELKKDLQASGYRSRFVAAQDGVLSSVQVVKNKLIETGGDILIIKGLNAFYLGKTVTVQDFEDYSARDYGRPRRDARSGLLPPKLAKEMINFSKATPEQTLLDPFCGSGTVLQEAALMGFRHLVGSDISAKAIEDTKKNLNWLEKNYHVTPAVRLHHSDVKKLEDKISPHSIDAIVTEPYLGPTINRNISVINMLAITQELESLYLAAFRVFTRFLKPDKQVVIIFPLFKTKNGIYTLKILEQLEKMGFRRQNPIPEKVSLFAKIGPTARGSLMYSRPDQKVEREIFIFQYKK